MAMNNRGTTQEERGEGLGLAEGLCLVVASEKLRLMQQLLPPIPFLWGFFFFFLSFCVALSVFLGFLQMPAFLQCEKEVREGTFISLLRMEKEGGILWGLGWGLPSRIKVRILKWGSMGHLRDSSLLPPGRILSPSLLQLPCRGL